ncbi:hypothetical protein Y032_0006g3079 [Ancylostoma ceylanicum]|uniref:Uncharacterized protein n=1 Tax=Ancylostoma ceylanicum TaxID=53326 RepID=A0A016VPY3_9BILA|nr:hypothetical protein Y032_0006g3079 [Ancylostoma ceylanicum]
MFGSNAVGIGRRTILYLLDGMSDFERENRRDDISILPDMVWRELDMAVEEIRVEVVDDLLHYPSRWGDRSIWAPEGCHLGLTVGEVSAGVADASPCLCGFCQHCCSSLLKVFFYRFFAPSCELGCEDISW